MHLSYKDINVREYCNSLNTNTSKTPFSIEEIMNIRAHVADLRAAPKLADVPMAYKIFQTSNSQSKVVIEFDQIKIICLVHSLLSNPNADKISRLQIVDIVKTDLQIEELKSF